MLNARCSSRKLFPNSPFFASKICYPLTPTKFSPAKCSYLAAILEKTDRKNPDNAYLIKAKRAVEAALT